jgi:hypothetical protein
LNTPFIPAAAWPGTVQRYLNVPFFRVIRSVALLPGPRSFVFLLEILKSCWRWPVFFTLKMISPPGAVFDESLKPMSNAVTLIVFTVAWVWCAVAGRDQTSAAAARATPRERLWILVMGPGPRAPGPRNADGPLARAVRSFRAARRYVTTNTPFIPAAAWPGTVHLYGYDPFLRVTLSVLLLPPFRSGVFRPSIWKSCWRWPVFFTLKMTIPLGADFAEILKPMSYAVTLIVAGIAWLWCAVAGSAQASVPSATARPRIATRNLVMSMRFLPVWVDEAGGP